MDPNLVPNLVYSGLSLCSFYFHRVSAVEIVRLFILDIVKSREWKCFIYKFDHTIQNYQS